MAVLAATWGHDDVAAAGAVAIGLVLAVAVLAAVHHAEVIAHAVGEPFGSLVLAVAVTVIEVGLVVMLMLAGGDDAAGLARDTVFAAVMITVNGIVGLSLLLATRGNRLAEFNAEGSGAAIGTVATLATLCLVLPTFTTSATGPAFSPAQLAFAGVVSVTLYVLFVLTQTVRHREFFLPPAEDVVAEVVPASPRAMATSVALLSLALLAVVGLAKVASHPVEDAVDAAGLPQSFVGVLIALVVLLPETVAAGRNARRGRTQISLNLAYGSAMASIGLTIPAIAVASIWIDGPLHLGLGGTDIVLLALTVGLSTLTVVPGRVTRMQAALHLALLGTYVFLAVNP